MQRAIKEIVQTKLGLSDLMSSWNQVGDTAVGIWVPQVQPPKFVGLADLVEHMDKCKEHEFFIGLGAGGQPKIISLDDDSPHIACSAGSGAGKSVLAMLIGIQVLRKGGKVIILDKKGSHRWARGLEGVTYCTKPADMHAALIGAASLADARNTQAMEEDDDWNPGHRVFVIFEEMNATVAMLRAYWETTRDKSEPKLSLAVTAFREIMYMGRSAKVNLFGVAQMLTANTTGGPEARENFGIRLLARYTLNNFRMLAPECAMPRKSKIHGRWQLVVAGEVAAVQVAFLHMHEAREIARSLVPMSPQLDTTPSDQQCPDVPTQARPDTTPAQVPAREELQDPFAMPITLQEAIETGIVTGKYETVKKQLQRSEYAPKPVGTRGKANLYRVSDLVEWSESAKR